MENEPQEDSNHSQIQSMTAILSWWFLNNWIYWGKYWEHGGREGTKENDFGLTAEESDEWREIGKFVRSAKNLSPPVPPEVLDIVEDIRQVSELNRELANFNSSHDEQSVDYQATIDRAIEILVVLDAIYTLHNPTNEDEVPVSTARYFSVIERGTEHELPIVDRPAFATTFNKLSTLYYKKYDQQRNLADLEMAHEMSVKALLLAPPGSVIRNALLFDNSMAARRAYASFGDLKYLLRSIELMEQATNEKERPKLLTGLCLTLMTAYQATYKFDYLKQAHSAGVKALSMPGNSEHVELLACLSECELLLHGRTSKQEHLEKAVEYGRESVRLSEPAKVDRRRYNLSCALAFAYEKSNSVAFLKEGIDILQELLEKSPDSPYVSTWLNTFGTLLMHKHMRSKECEELVKRLSQHGADIEMAYTAIHAVAEGDEQFLTAMQLPGKTLKETQQFFQSIDYPDDTIPDADRELDTAISCFRRAADAYAPGHPERAAILFNMVKTLGMRLRNHSRDEDENDLIEKTNEIMNSEYASVTIRMQAGAITARHLKDKGDWSRTSDFYDQVTGLISKIATRSLERDDTQFVLGHLQGLVAQAAAAGLQVGKDPAHVLEQLDAGRGIITSLMISLRSDLTLLATLYPEKCKEYEHLRACAFPLPSSLSTRQDITPTTLIQRQETVMALENLESEIRGLEGMEDFQKHMSHSSIKKQANGCYIVIFNVTELRADAIVVTQNSVVNIPLPELKLSKLRSWVERLIEKEKVYMGSLRTEGHRNSVLAEFLEWFWDVAVLPLFVEMDLLQYSARAIEDLPHIVWVAADLLAYFPIHAAGYHTPDPMDKKTLSRSNTISHVVSSYSATIQALAFTRKGPGKHKKSSNTPENHGPMSGRALVVTMEETPEYLGQEFGGLTVDKEVKAVKDNFKGVVDVLETPRSSEVLERIQSADLVHFACHGVISSSNASDGGLLFANHQTGEAEILSIRDLIPINLQSAEIAYLSACSTAETAERNIADESIHLANAFQLVGFSHVIGTLWEADDEMAGKVAKRFYQALKTGTDGGIKESSPVAYALHRAVSRYREKEPDSILTWAPFIHYGG